MQVSWPLIVLGALVALGFAALLCRRWASGEVGAWKRQATFYVDMFALVITVATVGSLATTQLQQPPEPEPTPVRRKQAVYVPPSPTATRTEIPATATPPPDTPIPTSTPTPAGATYSVVEGDTLAAIAERFGLSADALRQANGLTGDDLQIGQVLVLPPAPPTSVPPALITLPAPYALQQGDTINGIALRYGIDPADLLASNPGLQPDLLRIGQEIIIPLRVTTTPVPPTATATPEGTPASAQTPPESTPASAEATAAPTATATSAPAAPTVTPSVQRHTVRQGDTLAGVAQAWGVTPGQVLAANPGLNPDALQIGQELVIPGPGAPSVAVPALTSQYTIQRGDTLNGIALRYGLTAQQILAVNPGLSPDALRPGQTIVILSTGNAPAAPASVQYTIRQGDTLNSIGLRFGVTAAQIQAVNPGLQPGALRLGQVITIPQ